MRLDDPENVSEALLRTEARTLAAKRKPFLNDNY
jgi:hypothetical protein